MIAREVRFSERRLVTEAWREWRVNASDAGLSPDSLPVDPPSWFYLFELGFRWGEEEHSLMWTCRILEDHNRVAVEELGLEAPYRVTYPIPTRKRPRVVVIRRRPTHERVAALVRRRLAELRRSRGEESAA